MFILFHRYRGCVVAGGGCDQEYIGVASAPHWKGPYVKRRNAAYNADLVSPSFQ